MKNNLPETTVGGTPVKISNKCEDVSFTTFSVSSCGFWGSKLQVSQGLSLLSDVSLSKVSMQKSLTNVSNASVGSWSSLSGSLIYLCIFSSVVSSATYKRGNLAGRASAGGVYGGGGLSGISRTTNS